MSWKIRKNPESSWQLLIIPKPFLLGRGQALHKYGKLWIIQEYPCFTEDSKVKVYLFKQSQKPVMDRFFRKAMGFMLRLLGAATVTYLFMLWMIEQAFLERGYVAYGGELLLIPVVFYFMYKLMSIGKGKK